MDKTDKSKLLLTRVCAFLGRLKKKRYGGYTILLEKPCNRQRHNHQTFQQVEAALSKASAMSA